VDFQLDVTTDGRPVKIVSIVDEHTRECLGGLVERSITGEYLIAELDRLAAERGPIRGCCDVTTDPNWPAAQWPSGPRAMPAYTSSRRITPAQRLRRIVQLPHQHRHTYRIAEGMNRTQNRG
jgi:hypothetical protein